MKPSLIFSQYVWLVNTLRRYGRMTLEEINDKWQDDEVADGNPLSRSTFNRHRDAVLDMFGVMLRMVTGTISTTRRCLMMTPWSAGC